MTGTMRFQGKKVKVESLTPAELAALVDDDLEPFLQTGRGYNFNAPLAIQRVLEIGPGFTGPTYPYAGERLYLVIGRGGADDQMVTAAGLNTILRANLGTYTHWRDPVKHQAAVEVLAATPATADADSGLPKGAIGFSIGLVLLLVGLLLFLGTRD